MKPWSSFPSALLREMNAGDVIKNVIFFTIVKKPQLFYPLIVLLSMELIIVLKLLHDIAATAEDTIIVLLL